MDPIYQITIINHFSETQIEIERKALEENVSSFEKIPFSDSRILSHEQSNELMELCHLNKFQKWRLVYRGTDHGFRAIDFHEKCDGINKTLTIINSTAGYIFGGYTEKNWSFYRAYQKDESAFLFTLTNYRNEPKVFKCLKPESAIYSSLSFGPTFGAGHCLCISDRSNLNSNSYQRLDYSFFCDCPYLFNAGQRNFQTSEIEIYSKL